MRWAAAAGPASNPIADATGADAHRHQPGEVFFMAGTYGETVTRRRTVPAGMPLFFPLVNRWASPAGGHSVRLRGRTGRDFLVDVTYELTAG